jgi:hypothetical protein
MKAILLTLALPVLLTGCAGSGYYAGGPGYYDGGGYYGAPTVDVGFYGKNHGYYHHDYHHYDTGGYHHGSVAYHGGGYHSGNHFASNVSHGVAVTLVATTAPRPQRASVIRGAMEAVEDAGNPG